MDISAASWAELRGCGHNLQDANVANANSPAIRQYRHASDELPTPRGKRKQLNKMSKTAICNDSENNETNSSEHSKKDKTKLFIMARLFIVQ